MAATDAPQKVLEYAAPPQQRINPWVFVPVLYFMQSVPLQVVGPIFQTAYKKLGVDNSQIAVWTGVVSLAWTFKLLWSPLLDLNSTKRRWIIAMQLAIAGAMLAAAFAINASHFWPITLCVLAMIAFFSATHDIAADGFYILSTSETQRAAFVGVLTTCSRLGNLACTFGIVYFAGRLESAVGIPRAWMYALMAASLLYGLGLIYNFFFLPAPAADTRAPCGRPGDNARNIGRTLVVIFVGACLYLIFSGGLSLNGHAICLLFGRPENWRMDPQGVRNSFIMLIIGAALAGPGILATQRLLRRTAMADAFLSYVRQPGIGAILSFIIFYRLGEAMVKLMARFFYLDPIEKGGLGLQTTDLARIDGIAGVVGIILGGIVGGTVVAKLGLRRSFWPLAICMHTPNLLYVWASFAHQPPMWSIYVISFVDQFGYGFGYAGFILYLMHVATRGNFKTTHYAIGTGLAALSTFVIAQILAAILQSSLGYRGLFISVCVLTVPGMLTLLFIPLEPRKEAV